jgi:hypothetical protein
MLHDVTYQTAALLRDDQPGFLFRFGSKEKYTGLTAIGGDLVYIIKDGDIIQKLTAENAYTPGEWFTASVMLSGDEGKLVVNGKTAASGAITLDPVDIVTPDAVYTIGEGLNGSMDFFRVFTKEVPEPEYYYTAKEDITSEPEQPWYYGDMDKNAVIDVYDLALLKRAVLAGEHDQWADCDADGTTGVGDIIALTRYLHRLPEHGQTGQANTT